MSMDLICKHPQKGNIACSFCDNCLENQLRKATHEIARLKAEIEKLRELGRAVIKAGDGMSGTYEGPVKEFLSFNAAIIALRKELEK